MFWYFGWYKRNVKAKCLISSGITIYRCCTFAETANQSAKMKKKIGTSQVSQPRVSQKEKKKMHKSSQRASSQQFWARLALLTQSFAGKTLSNLDWNVDAGSSILIPREHLSHSSSTPTMLYLRLQEFSPLQDQVVSQEGCSFGHQHGSESVVLKPQPLWAPAQRKHAQHLGHPHLVQLASTSPRWRFMLLHSPFILFCVISFVNAHFQHSTFPFSQHIASKIPVCSRDYQKHVGMKSPDYSRRPSLYNNSSNYHLMQQY